MLKGKLSGHSIQLFKQSIVSILLILIGTTTWAQNCTNTTNIPTNGQVSINGVQITTSSTGSVDLYTFLPSFTSCAIYTVNSNPLWVGSTGPWSITFNFDVPVNDLLFVINATGQMNNEDFIFNSNAGTTTVISTSNCFTTISGNTILSGASAGSEGGGGFFTINSPTPYTQLVVNGNGGEAGSLMAICAASIVEEPSCAIATIVPAISQTNTCLAGGTFDLSTITTTNTPAGTTLNWFNSTPATAAGLIADPTSVTAGTYYAAYYDPVFDCYSLTSQFTVNPDPVAGFTNGSACEDNPITFTDQSTVSVGNITDWSWNFGDGTTSNLQNPSHTFASGINQNVTLTVTTAAGCTNSLTQAITLNASPLAEFQFQAGCANDPILFTDLSTVSNGSITDWNWSFGDGTTGSVQNPQHQYNSAGGYTVTLTVTSDLGCTDVFSQQVVTSAPDASFAFTSACENTQTQFTDQSTLNGGSIISWNWDLGDGTTSNLQNPSHMYPGSGTYTVQLIVTSSVGCSDTYTQQVVVSENPVAAFNAVGACSGTSIPFTDLSSIGVGTIASWDWDFGDGGSSSSQNPAHTYTAGGLYNVTLEVTSAAGCSNSISQPLTISQTPTAAFSYQPTEPDILNTTVYFTNQSVGGTSYTWNFGDEGNSNTTNPTFIFPELPGNYEIMLVANNGFCTDTTRTILVIKDVLIYYIPNTFTPDGDEFNQTFVPVFTNGYDPYDFNMKIYNRWGELIFESNDASVGWDGSYKGMYVPDGMYTWQIEFKTTMSDERVLINGHVSKLK